MARRKKEHFKKRFIAPDPVYGSKLVQQVINVVMERGKKNCARKIVYGALDLLVKRHNGDKAKALEFFNQALGNIFPLVEVRSRRVGGGVYQIPREVPVERSCAVGIRWYIQAASVRPDKTMVDRMAQELLDAANGRGNAVRKKNDTHKMAEANRAFSHYVW